MTASLYSANKLNEFFDYVISKGLMNKETANSRKIASSKILDILEDDEKSDLRQLDRDQAFQRFVNLRGRDYNPQSLSVYKSRFSAALDDFIAWVSDPVSFKPSTQTRASKNVKKLESRERRQTVSLEEVEKRLEQPPQTGNQEPPSSEHLSLPIPLRRGVVVKIQGLPNDLTPDEAKKISAIISAYAQPIDTREEL
jgi:site-specific recombinase XerC